jgi:hypothetical protein
MAGGGETHPPDVFYGLPPDQLQPSRIARMIVNAPALSDESFFLPFHEVNQRCIEMLIEAGKASRDATVGLVSDLHDLLQTISPIERRRAAQRAFLLVDLQFGDIRWWADGAAADASAARLSTGHVYFPRTRAMRLARATLTLAWHTIRSDRNNAYIVLGMTEPVAMVISRLRFEEIDKIAERRFKYIRPRWSDRPGIWREILCGNSELSQRHADLHGLQLLTGELLARRTVP